MSRASNPATTCTAPTNRYLHVVVKNANTAWNLGKKHLRCHKFSPLLTDQPMKNIESNCIWRKAKHKLCRVVEASKHNNIIQFGLPSYYGNKMRMKIIKANSMKFLCLANILLKAKF